VPKQSVQASSAAFPFYAPAFPSAASHLSLISQQHVPVQVSESPRANWQARGHNPPFWAGWRPTRARPRRLAVRWLVPGDEPRGGMTTGRTASRDSRATGSVAGRRRTRTPTIQRRDRVDGTRRGRRAGRGRFLVWHLRMRATRQHKRFRRGGGHDGDLWPRQPAAWWRWRGGAGAARCPAKDHGGSVGGPTTAGMVTHAGSRSAGKSAPFLV
jgi:hypothetical protein